MLDKENQYTSIYFPFDMLAKKEKTYWNLLDVSSNFSKLIVDVMHSACKIAGWLKKKRRNRMQYDWGIVIRDKQTGEIMLSVGDGAIKCINSKRYGSLKRKT